MRFRLDDEHRELAKSVRAFFGDIADGVSVRRDMETKRGWNEDSWQRMCTELELVSLGVPERYGGTGFGLVEMGVVLGEAGRALVCAPLLSTTLAAQVLCQGVDELAASEFLPSISSGVRRATIAFTDPTAATPTRAVESSQSWVLTGTKEWVLDGHTADLLVVSAESAGGVSLFLVHADAPGLIARPQVVIDPTRKVATISFAETPARLLGTEGDAGATLRASRDIATVLLAAEQVGLARACLNLATEYACQREQFGRPIGSFQAIKHALATVLMEVEVAEAAALYAAFAADHQLPECSESACVAAVTCSGAAMLAASTSIQVHGGIAMTWEHPAHLYLKRATTNSKLFGDTQYQLDRLAMTAM